MSRWATRVIRDGMGPCVKVGMVGSVGEALSEGRVGRGAYDLVVSDKPSIYNGRIN